MRKYLVRAATVMLAASLAACGGGDDSAEPTLGLDGSYSVGCYPVQEGDLPVSARSYLDINGLRATSTDYYFVGDDCRGDAFASVTSQQAQLSGMGTKTVSGPNGSGSVTALKVLVSTSGEPVPAKGNVRLTPSGTTIEVLYPNSNLVVNSYDAFQERAEYRDLMARLGDGLYFGDDDAPLDAQEFPVALDYSDGWFLL